MRTPIKYIGNTSVWYTRFCLGASIIAFSMPVLCWSAEQPVKSTHSLQAHMGHNQHRDDNLAGIVHSGNTIGAAYNFTRRGRGITQIAFSADYSSLIQPLEFERQSFSMNSHLQVYRLLPNAKWPGLYLGGAVGLWNSVSHYPYWDEQHVYWATSADVSLALKYEIHSRSTHVFGLETPVLSMVSRPVENRMTVADDISFSGFIDSFFSDFDFGTLNYNFGLSGSYEYHPGWLEQDISVTAGFHYQRVTNENSLPFKRIQLMIGTKYSF